MRDGAFAIVTQCGNVIYLRPFKSFCDFSHRPTIFIVLWRHLLVRNRVVLNPFSSVYISLSVQRISLRLCLVRLLSSGPGSSFSWYSSVRIIRPTLVPSPRIVWNQLDVFRLICTFFHLVPLAKYPLLILLYHPLIVLPLCPI